MNLSVNACSGSGCNLQFANSIECNRRFLKPTRIYTIKAWFTCNLWSLYNVHIVAKPKKKRRQNWKGKIKYKRKEKIKTIERNEYVNTFELVRKVRRKGYKNLLNNLNCSDFIFASQIELTNRTMYCYTLIFLQWDNIKTCCMILISMLKLFNLSKCYFATLSSCEMLMLMASLAKSGLKLKSSMNGWQNENLFVFSWKWNNIITVNLFIISYYVGCMT